MNDNEFDTLINKRLERIKQSLIIKAKEYTRNDNRLHNFEVGAKMFNQTPTRVLDGFLNKHLISYRDMLDDIDQGKYIDDSLIKERFGDLINYFIIQEIIISSKYSKPF